MDFLFNSDIVNLLLKTNEGKDRGPNFVIFVVWSALIVGDWVVVASDKSFCLGRLKTHHLCSGILFRLDPGA